MRVFVVLLAVAAFLSGCSSVNIERNPHVDVTKMTRFYVEHRLSDNHQVDQAIVADLRARGFEASAGPLTMMPEGVQAIVSYQDEWAWDFKSYLIQLHLNIRSAHKNQTLAFGTYRQPTPRPKSLADVIAALNAKIFKQP